MKTLFLLLFILLTSPINFILADDDLDLLVKNFPSILTNYSNLNNSSSSIKHTWSRSDLLEMFSINQLSLKDNQLMLNGSPIEFLPPEQSKANYPDLANRRAKLPLVIYQWQFEIEPEGDYIIAVPSEVGTEGFLNNESIIILNNGIISKKNSGKQTIKLSKGRITLYLPATPGSSSQLTIIPESKIEFIINEINKKLISKNKEDFDWLTNNFLPYLNTLQNGSHLHITKILTTLNKSQPFEKNEKSIAFLKSLVTPNFNGYMIEKYIYLNFPEIYFNLSKNENNKNSILNGFLWENNLPRTIFLQQLIYDGQKSIANQYLEKCFDLIKNNTKSPEKELLLKAFYLERFISYFRIGRIKDANEILKITSENAKSDILDRYLEGRPEQEDNITLTNSFDETNAFQIKEMMEAYSGGENQLAVIYKTFIELNSHLVKKDYGAVSLMYLFQQYKKANEKLNQDFEKYCLEKINTKLEKSIKNRDLNLLVELLEQNEMITPMPEIRLILMDEYFKSGAYLKAISQAYLIYEKYPAYIEKIISKMVVLENISDLSPEHKVIITDKFLKLEIKLNGLSTTLEKLRENPNLSEKKWGKLLNAIPLEPTHLQYWNHPQIPYYQPMEPLFTKSNIILNGASSLASYSIKNNTIEWLYHSENEYAKEKENGPHQKRFITTHAGNQLFFLTNADYSSQKTIKCLDLRGNLLWDISDQKSSITEEPICTPIESHGKLFCLTYSNHEDINTVNYSVYDPGNGKLISRTPLSLIPNSYRDDICRVRSFDWNSFTHDNHFIKDNSSIYGFSGTGIIFKADSNSGNLLWAKGFQKPSLSNEDNILNDLASSTSGYINIYEEVIVAYMPETRSFSAINKNTGEIIWKTNIYRPKFIHDRGKSNYLYFSNDNIKKGPMIYKVDPKDGAIIWQKSSLGLPISGEGDLFGNKLYIPSAKAIFVLDEITGDLLETIKLNIQPLKIRCSQEHSVIFTNKTAFMLQNNGSFNPHLMVERDAIIKTGKLIEPDTPTPTTISFENINLETTLKIPETYYSYGDPYKQTNLLKTSKPFHFLLACKEHLSLFREGYYLKDSKYIPPEVLWYGPYPNYAILEDTLYISEFGKIVASNLFTREKIWAYDYDSLPLAFKNEVNKTQPTIAVSKQYIAFQTENQTICILENNSLKKLQEFYTPTNRSMLIEENFIISISATHVRCYDISQKCIELWRQEHSYNCEFGIHKGTFIISRNREGTMTSYDLKTGNVILKVKSIINGKHYEKNSWQINDQYIYSFGILYDAITGLPIERYKEATKVTGGGFIGFIKQFGPEGHYLLDGKELSFITQCNRNQSNNLFAASRKGNRITFFSSFGIESFEITNDRLISLEYINFYSGPYGNSEAGMALLPLDNSFLMLRKDEMYFYKNFDMNLNYEKIKSFRVENKKNVVWPYSELYPEIEIGEKNWISYNGEKPKRKLYYQAFGDEKFAYLKFKLSPRLNNFIKNNLFISGNSFDQVFAITWDADNWKNCQYTFNIKNNIESWKETDIQGNLILYIKLQLTYPISSKFKNTLPDFNIEMRQMTGKQNEGMYRIGGAYFKSRKFFPWLNYSNDEAQSLKNYNLRSNVYEKSNNFYPPGEDLILWLKDRRRFKSVESNIQLLNKMLTENAKYYCSVSILSALFLEEIYALKTNHPDLLEVSDEFSQKANEILLRLHKESLSKGINKEWADFALTFWTVEVFPFKFDYYFNNHFFKAIYSLQVRNSQNALINNDFFKKDNPLTNNINQPYLEWVLPGLSPHYPNNQSYSNIDFFAMGTFKTGLGRMMLYAPNGTQEFCNRKGKFINNNSKIISRDNNSKLEIRENFYLSKNKRYDCFNIIYNERPNIGISIEVPAIKTPTKLENTGQTTETIITALDNLPSDNSNGLTLIDYYISLRGNIDEKELINIYGKWLNSLKDNSSATYHALNSIYNKNEKNKNVLSLIGQIIKEAKLTPLAPRQFFLDKNNQLMNKKARSILGPVFQELETKPEINFDPTGIFKSKEQKFQFNENLENKNGGFIYIASKIILEDKDKVFLFSRARNSGSLISVWVNGNQIVDNKNYISFEGDTLAQKINLNKGENIILLKITGIKDHAWDGYYYSFNIGDVYGEPVKGIELQAVHR